MPDFTKKHNLLSLEKKLIGWGSGGFFDYFNQLLPLPLAYLIDNATTPQGTIKDGFEIFPPEKLLTEDPQKTIVIIYSSFYNEIAKQLADLGPFTTINASILSSDYRQQWERIENLIHTPAPICKSTQKNSNCAILIQGPIIAGLTAKIVRIYAQHYPNIPTILSTWDGTDENLLDEVTPLIDTLLLTPPPPFPGVQNRNLQIVSTIKGLHYCQKIGAKRVLKVRSDMFILAKDLLNKCDHLLTKYDPTACQLLGASNRIIIPQSFTRKYIPYHPSDLVMYGAIEDLLNFWKCPLDNRRFDLQKACKTIPLSQLGCDGLVAESYFGINYCKAFNFSPTDNLNDSWKILRDLFIVVDNNWFDLFWPKNPHIPASPKQQHHRETVSHKFWSGLISRKQTIDIDITQQRWG